MAEDVRRKIERLKELWERGKISDDAYRRLLKEYEERLKHKPQHRLPVVMLIIAIIIAGIAFTLGYYARSSATPTVIITTTLKFEYNDTKVETIALTNTKIMIVTTPITLTKTITVTRTVIRPETTTVHETETVTRPTTITLTKTVTVTKTVQQGSEQSPSLTLFEPEIDGLTVTINGVTMPGTPGTMVTRIHWDWGDGSSEDRWFPASHTYSRAGTYTITVTSYQSDGLHTTKSVTVILGELIQV